MINITLLTEDDKNRLVTYTDYKLVEHGRITSWNDSFIFVDFDNTGRGQACHPDRLEFQHLTASDLMADALITELNKEK